MIIMNNIDLLLIYILNDHVMPKRRRQAKETLLNYMVAGSEITKIKRFFLMSHGQNIGHTNHLQPSACRYKIR